MLSLQSPLPAEVLLAQKALDDVRTKQLETKAAHVQALEATDLSIARLKAATAAVAAAEDKEKSAHRLLEHIAGRSRVAQYHFYRWVEGKGALSAHVLEAKADAAACARRHDTLRTQHQKTEMAIVE
eukprot:Sspe_Gene.5363::Locus_1771_Transcript_1_1_Confidence_1.000_Length_416::g.5363::m.5363